MWPNFDLFFVESEDYKQGYLARGMEVMTAFGCNTNLYDPEDITVKGQSKVFDVVFPATFAAWKRHDLFSKATYGYRTSCAGYMYTDHEMECWQEPQKSGCLTVPHLPATCVKHLLAAGSVCLITSANNGGSQRTVLEAMAMNVPVIVMSDSDKTSEYVFDAIDKGYKVGAVVPPEEGAIRRAINEWLDAKANGRQFILDKWSHVVYANSLEEGLQRLLGNRLA
jgi:glycosyltransferase involved in cell wall biosynthesis